MNESTKREIARSLLSGRRAWYVRFMIRNSMNLDRVSHRIYGIKRDRAGQVSVRLLDGWQACERDDLVWTDDEQHTI